jgi:hypothetical protein
MEEQKHVNTICIPSVGKIVVGSRSLLKVTLKDTENDLIIGVRTNECINVELNLLALDIP